MVENLVELLPGQTGAAVTEVACAAQGRQLLGDAVEGVFDAMHGFAGDFVAERRCLQTLVQAFDGLGVGDAGHRANQNGETPRDAFFERRVRNQDLQHRSHRRLPELARQSFG